MIHLLAPTEHDLHAYYRTNGLQLRVSSMPELHGCDALVLTSSGVVGFQRKTLPDLQASLLDGRLYKELAQIQASATLVHCFLIIESDLRRTVDGNLIESSTLTIDIIRSIIAKFAASSVAYLPTSSIPDTANCIDKVSRYIASDSFSTIRRPKQVKNAWGTVDSSSFALWLLQSFPGIGPKQAAAIHSHFATVPIRWTVTEAELIKVPGIGKKTAAALLRALDNS